MFYVYELDYKTIRKALEKSCCTLRKVVYRILEMARIDSSITKLLLHYNPKDKEELYGIRRRRYIKRNKPIDVIRREDGDDNGR